MNSGRTFADLVNQNLSFDSSIIEEKIILELIDNPWVQRLRDIRQTAHTNLVYMFSEHSRFGHSLGVAYLTRMVLNHLKKIHPNKVAEYELAVGTAALIHDIGHLAPGSHAAFKCWFPNSKDIHEQIALKIVREDTNFRHCLESYSELLPFQVSAILNESSTLPPWCHQIISGSGWNSDRGNWCIVDSILAGVDYGKYNIPAIVESLSLTEGGELVFFEKIDLMQ
jgi:uncharacterized protein